MEYSNIVNKLSQISDMVQSWENQGFAPTIEKGIVLDSLKDIYSELYDRETSLSPAAVAAKTPTVVDAIIENNEIPEETEPVIVEEVDPIETTTTPQTFFETIESGLKNSIIFELFNGNEEKAKKEVNNLSTFSSIEDILIFIEENFNWNPSCKAATELIKLLSSKF